MKKKVNKGFSIIEVIIALAIFAVFMIPIVSTTISSLRQSVGAKELQSRDDFAKAAMEYIKGASVEDAMSPDFYKDTLGATYVSSAINSDVVKVLDEHDNEVIGSDGKPLTYGKHSISGKIQLGNKDAIYDFFIQLDNEYYVMKGQEDKDKDGNKDFIDPNTLTLGIVEDLDTDKVAMVDGTFSNFDTAVEEDFLTKKLENLMNSSDESWKTKYQQYMQNKQDSTLFADDTGKRIVTVKIETTAAGKYLVSCVMDYWDYSIYLTDDQRHIQRGFYGKEFDSLTNVYLMYNPFFYNGGYSSDDYIVIDRTGLKDVPQKDSEGNEIKDSVTGETVYEDVNVFVIETANTASDDVINAKSITSSTEETSEAATTEVSKSILYRNDISNGSTRENVKVHILTATKGNRGILGNLNIYHNFGTDRTNKNYYCSEKNVDTSMNTAYSTVYPGKSLVAPWEDDTYTQDTGKDAYVAGLGEAGKEQRSLYNVKIWVKEAVDKSPTSATVDINTKTDEPILEGTMGGSES